MEAVDKFIDSLTNFNSANQTDKILWLIFYKLYIEKNKCVAKEDIKVLMENCWLGVKNFDQLWFFLVKNGKIIKKGDCFVLNREIYKSMESLYSPRVSLNSTIKKLKKTAKDGVVIIPTEVLKKLDKDIAKHCIELNDNLQAENWIASMLLMRKILPLAIIRKFQKDKNESSVKDSSGEYLACEKLLEKVQTLVQPRIYKELKEIKFLYDGVQHFFVFTPHKTDISPASIRLRVFLEELF